MMPLRPPLEVHYGEPPELFIPAWHPAGITGYQRLGQSAGVTFEAIDPAWPRLPVEGAGGHFIVVAPAARPPIVAWATPIAMVVLCAIGLLGRGAW